MTFSMQDLVNNLAEFLPIIWPAMQVATVMSLVASMVRLIHRAVTGPDKVESHPSLWADEDVGALREDVADWVERDMANQPETYHGWTCRHCGAPNWTDRMCAFCGQPLEAQS